MELLDLYNHDTAHIEIISKYFDDVHFAIPFVEKRGDESCVEIPLEEMGQFDIYDCFAGDYSLAMFTDVRFSHDLREHIYLKFQKDDLLGMSERSCAGEPLIIVAWQPLGYGVMVGRVVKTLDNDFYQMAWNGFKLVFDGGKLWNGVFSEEKRSNLYW